MFKNKTKKENKNEKSNIPIKSTSKSDSKRILILIIIIGLITSVILNQILSYQSVKSNINIKHKLAVVVPFRDRFDELLVFVPHISKFLISKSIDFKIYIINQVDNYRFNRASLINVGFLISMKECDYMVMHDVDLLPLNDLLNYSYPSNGPFHISSSGLHPDYNYTNFIGGILIVTKSLFLKTNGMSNRYYGWGKEDDEFYIRLKEANVTVERPNINLFKTKNKFTFFNNHDSIKRPRDKKRYLKQKKESLKFDQTGLNNIQYRVVSVKNISIENYPCTIVNVEFFCDRFDTHWCNNEFQFFE